MSQEEKIAYFGVTDFRNKKVKFGIKNDDRSRHMYVIGKTGMGKSTLLENIAAQDIRNGEGMCFVDPHGSAIDTLLDYVPEERVQDVIYFAPFDRDYPISFNVLEDVEADERHLVMAGLMATFVKIWPDTFSERMKYILSNILLALLEYPGATLLGVNRMLADKDYRNDVIAHITDASVKAFWVDEYNKWDPRYAREAGAAIQNKIGQFTSNPLIRNIIGQEKTSFNFRKIMDEKKIFLVNLSKGRIGETNANLLGGMLITKLYLAAMSRADAGTEGIKKLPPFFLFVDEFQNFANESFADILAEARKYKLNLTIAHQYIEQMPESVAAAVFGNVGTIISFRVGATDAEVLEKQFAPVFSAEDIVNLGKFQIYLSLMIDGIGSKPFSANTLPPLPKEKISLRNHIIANSRYFYTQKREEVERSIQRWYEPIKKAEKRSIAQEKPQKKKQKKAKKEKEEKFTSSELLDKQEKQEKKSSETLHPQKQNTEMEVALDNIVSDKLKNLLDGITLSKKGEVESEKEQEKNEQMKTKKKVLRESRDDTKQTLAELIQQAVALDKKAKKKNKKGEKGVKQKTQKQVQSQSDLDLKHRAEDEQKKQEQEAEKGLSEDLLNILFEE